MIAVGALCAASTRKPLNVTFASTVLGALATPVAGHICVAKAIAVRAVQIVLALPTVLAFEAGRAVACAISEARPMPAAIHFRNALDGEDCVVALHRMGKVGRKVVRPCFRIPRKTLLVACRPQPLPWCRRGIIYLTGMQQQQQQASKPTKHECSRGLRPKSRVGGNLTSVVGSIDSYIYSLLTSNWTDVDRVAEGVVDDARICRACF